MESIAANESLPRMTPKVLVQMCLDTEGYATRRPLS